MVFLIESESSITYITPKKQNLLFEAERFKEQNQLYRFFWAKNSTSLRKNEGFRPIKIICRRTFLVSISIFSTLFHFILLFHRGIWYLACEQQTHIRSSLRSLRKIASANPSGKTISVTWSLLFWCWPIRSKDRIRLKWLLATSRAEASWISARVNKYALEREFRDHNKVSYDVECWLLYEATTN